MERAIGLLESATAPMGAAGSTAESSRYDVAHIETPTGDLDVLLAFQERLSELDGVTKVTVTGSTTNRSTFLVELAQESGQDSSQAILCSVCERVIREGRRPASHGLCEDCRASYGSSLR